MNSRYGVSVEYPAAIFHEGEAPPDNAGRSFNAEDGARFYVYSHANALDQSVDAILAETVDGVDPAFIRDKTVDAQGFAVTVARADEIVHTIVRTSEGGTMIHWLEIGYPPALDARYGAVAARMVESLTVDDTGVAEQTGTAEPVQPAETTPPAAGSAVAVANNGWITTQPSTDYADLPALMPETDFSADTDLGQFVFVCQKAEPSTAFFALIVAPQFAYGPQTPARLAIDGAGSGGALDLTMQDLYASEAAEKPDIDWDASILFAPVEMEDIGQLIQADALLVTVAGATYRIAGGASLQQAGDAFLRECGN